MSNFWHRVGAVLGSVAVIVPAIGAIPGKVPSAIVAGFGFLTALYTSLAKVTGKE